MKYDPSVEINDGKDISIDMWEWGSDELFQEIIDMSEPRKFHTPTIDRDRTVSRRSEPYFEDTVGKVFFGMLGHVYCQ